ncbi:MAG: tetratricopeptide repeat protein [Deltaproteobacteria bacterium]|nr:MAG: tetratricopeptide repeat protein [Deltaproteobacteria bacterium]
MSDEQDPQQNPFHGFKVEIDPQKLEETVREIRDRVRESFKTGRYTKVRISYKGRQLLPDVPFALFLATEGAAFWLTSPLLAVLINLGANAVLDVEFLHEADELVQEGLSLYLDGEIEEAERRYRQALDKRPDDPAALYNLGTLLRVTGRTEEAKSVLRRASMGPEGHPDVARAAEALARMESHGKNL